MSTHSKLILWLTLFCVTRSRTFNSDSFSQQDNASKFTNISQINISANSLFPLRIPIALQEHIESFQSDAAQDEQHLNNRNPKDYDANRGSLSVRERQRLQQQQPLRPGVYSCGHQGAEMFINFINPRFPEQDTSTGSCVFKVELKSLDICQIRVDFVDTELMTPVNGNCNDQYMQVAGATWPNGIKKLCGINSDQHFYVQVDHEKRDKTVDFTITTVASGKGYKFGFWITQINCASRSPIEAPPGCTQYYLGRQGIIKTFNFEGVQYLANHNYRVCIRTERDACFMAYESDANHFLFKLYLSRSNRKFSRAAKGVTTTSGRGEEDCGLDYVLIPGGRGNTSRTGPSFDRFCGGRLNVESNEADSIPIYSEITSAVSWIQVVTSAREDIVQGSSTTKRHKNSSFFPFMSFGGGYGVSSINEQFEGTGIGMRLSYSQINSCLTSSFYK